MQITVEEATTITGAKIKVIGVGGGGSNMISHLIAGGSHEDIELAIANTDAQALNASPAPIKIQLGARLTKGLGAGMQPETGRNAAIESFEDIKALLSGTDIVFISAGLGGGTGTGAAPIIAQAAKEAGALTISIVTKPFKFEGSKRSKLAEQGLAELKKESDSIVVIPNDKLLSIVDKNLGIKESFKIVDDVLARAVNGMSGIILNHGENDINVDFADVRTVMSHRGLALMGIGESSGNNAAYEAIKNAIESPLFDNMSINGAMGVLVHFYIHPDYPLQQISSAMEIVEECASSDAYVIFGTTTDASAPKDAVKITIVATGFEKELVRPDSQEEANTLKLVASKDLSQSTKALSSASTFRKVSGGDYEQNEDILEIPTFIRKQMD
ncbi:cell division protein FtsZ [Wolinella succinogenes]|uniref:cell division protein FtsZ n=1 Tax=Wolinella succinogenes TaxID=844 RepID=UPI002409A8FA|nr:cell division protein FtsZ [Wolinella succinogenes]